MFEKKRNRQKKREKEQKAKGNIYLILIIIKNPHPLPLKKKILYTFIYIYLPLPLLTSSHTHIIKNLCFRKNRNKSKRRMVLQNENTRQKGYMCPLFFSGQGQNMPLPSKKHFTLWICVQCRTIFREENWLFPGKLQQEDNLKSTIFIRF